jgi:predicted O-methyltransferase YrrM
MQIKRTDVINYLISKYGYKKYLEIGVRKASDNFNKIKCETRVGVDPKPRGVCTHKMTSDDFFLQNKKMFDIVFIDGLHIEEQVEKDIKNSLAILAANGTIVVHDCNPPTEWHQRGGI